MRLPLPVPHSVCSTSQAVPPARNISHANSFRPRALRSLSNRTEQRRESLHTPRAGGRGRLCCNASAALDAVCFTFIVDDIVFPDGKTLMGVLGGGGGAHGLFCASVWPEYSPSLSSRCSSPAPCIVATPLLLLSGTGRPCIPGPQTTFGLRLHPSSPSVVRRRGNAQSYPCRDGSTLFPPFFSRTSSNNSERSPGPRLCRRVSSQA